MAAALPTARVRTATMNNFNDLVSQYYLREGAHMGDIQLPRIDLVHPTADTAPFSGSQNVDPRSLALGPNGLEHWRCSSGPGPSCALAGRF